MIRSLVSSNRAGFSIARRWASTAAPSTTAASTPAAAATAAAAPVAAAATAAATTPVASAVTRKVPKKIGAFRGGFSGFLTGTVLAGIAAYYYLVDEYRVANSLVVSDVVALNGAVQRLEAHIKSLEARIDKK